MSASCCPPPAPCGRSGISPDSVDRPDRQRGHVRRRGRQRHRLRIRVASRRRDRLLRRCVEVRAVPGRAHDGRDGSIARRHRSRRDMHGALRPVRARPGALGAAERQRSRAGDHGRRRDRGARRQCRRRLCCCTGTARATPTCARSGSARATMRSATLRSASRRSASSAQAAPGPTWPWPRSWRCLPWRARIRSDVRPGWSLRRPRRRPRCLARPASPARQEAGPSAPGVWCFLSLASPLRAWPPSPGRTAAHPSPRRGRSAPAATGRRSPPRRRRWRRRAPRPSRRRRACGSCSGPLTFTSSAKLAELRPSPFFTVGSNSSLSVWSTRLMSPLATMATSRVSSAIERSTAAIP